MSVMVKDRHLAKSQFENTFEKFYLDTTRILHGTSKRRQSSICEDLTYLINTMYDHIMVISEHRFAKSSRARKLRHDNVIAALQMIPQLEKYTMVYSNVTCKPFAKQCNWVSTLNVEVKLLNGLLDNESEKIEYIVGVLDWEKIKSFKVLSNMSYLHRFVHGKTVRAKGTLQNGASPHLQSLADDAFYSIMHANKYIPQTAEQRDDRLKELSHALDCLREMERHTLSFFNIMGYSDSVQKDWTDSLVLELRLLSGLIESDKTRFKNLI